MSILLASSSNPSSWATGVLMLALLGGLIWFWRDRDARAASPMLRVQSSQDAAPAWMGLGVMTLFYVYTPLVVAVLLGQVSAPAAASMGDAATHASAQPSNRPVDLTLMVTAQVATCTLALSAAAGLHAFLRSPVRRLFGLARPTPAQRRFLILMCLIALPLTYLTASVSQLIWQALNFTHPDAHPMLEGMAQLRERPALRLASILGATVLAPVFEEVFFRGHLQTGLVGLLRKRSLAVLVTSLLFAVVHPTWTWPAIFVLSLLIGWLYERTNNLWLAIGLHVGFNVISTSVFLAR